MEVKSLKYASEEENILQVVLPDGASLSVPWPCYTWHNQEIQEAIDSGMVIQPFKTEEELLAAAKEKIWVEIEAERDKRTKTGGYKCTTSDGVSKWFHSDSFSRTQQIALAQLCDSLPADLQWKTMDGSFVTMTKELANLIVVCAALSDQAIFDVAEQHKVNAFKLADPATYDYSGGWPKVFGE